MNSWNLLLQKVVEAHNVIRFKNSWIAGSAMHGEAAEGHSPASLCDGGGCWDSMRAMTAESGLPAEHLLFLWSQTGSRATLTAGLTQ